jgi:hypothetical protein
MTIQSGDIKFVRSQVMDDVPEGGGAPTGVTVQSGLSNEIFPDVSETDRALGNVRMRKVVLGVTTDDTDTLLGANVIISRPPADPNVSMALFSTGAMFDRRVDAVARLEGYLSIGAATPMVLYGNHISGQNTLLVYQTSDGLPAIGSTLVLTKLTGQPGEFREYVRIAEASRVLRRFEDPAGVFERYIVSLKLQNSLTADFSGFDVSRFEIAQEQLDLRTRISDTVVADAARYYGVSALQLPAALGEFTIKAASMFAQLVPSAQIEVPIADARTNQLSTAALSAGGAIVQTVVAFFHPTQSLFMGGAMAPGTVTVEAGGVVVSDGGGRLLSGGAQVGTVDYDNGVLALIEPVFGLSAQTFTVSYQPAATPITVTQSQGLIVTAENRSLSFVRTIEPSPQPGTLVYQYMSGGRWYVLRDDGSGAIRGASSAVGAGYLNAQSGTLSVTMGALPDVGSAIIVQYVPPLTARQADQLTLDNGGDVYWPINTSGEVSIAAGTKGIVHGAVSISWKLPTEPLRVITDDGEGNLQGFGTGTVDYANGVMRVSPTALPPPGTPISVSLQGPQSTSNEITFNGALALLGASNITPGSVWFTAHMELMLAYQGGPYVGSGPADYQFRDNGVGGVEVLVGEDWLACGVIDYGAGSVTLADSVAVTPAQAYRRNTYDTFLVGAAAQQVMGIYNTLG